MVYAVQARLTFRNTSRRDTIAQNIQTRLSQAVTWGQVTVTNSQADPSVTVTVRFQTRAEADSFWADVQAAVGTGINGPVTGSAIWRHDCPHDEPAHGPCVVADRVVW
jgi:hypothetical protein